MKLLLILLALPLAAAAQVAENDIRLWDREAQIEGDEIVIYDYRSGEYEYIQLDSLDGAASYELDTGGYRYYDWGDDSLLESYDWDEDLLIEVFPDE